MKPRFVSFHYVVKSKTGEVLATTRDGEPMMFLEGSGQIMPQLEAGLKGMSTGEKKQIFIHSSDAYGSRDEKLVMEVPITELPGKKNIKEGSQFKLERKNESPVVYRVIRVSQTHVLLDGNHPLAGQDLYFEVEIQNTREATSADATFDENESGPSKMTH